MKTPASKKQVSACAKHFLLYSDQGQIQKSSLNFNDFFFFLVAQYKNRKMDHRVWPLLFVGRDKGNIAIFCIFPSVYHKKKID